MSRDGMPHEKRIAPSLWVSLKPFGYGEGHANNYAEIARAIGDNRDHLLYAWRILNHGVCDGCSLGTTGMRDWTTDQIHLCNVRLRMLRLNTLDAMDSKLLEDPDELSQMRGAQLRELGRLSHPMIRRRGDRGFQEISWDRALDLIADRLRSTSPERVGVYMTNRGEPNENYFAVQKAVRAIGTNSIDSSARVCHSPSTFGLKESLGVAATTCSYSDWIGSDLVVFIGSNVAENQPVAMKYLFHAKKAGTKVAVINPYREPAMDRFWVPSNVESALFGTKITDRFFQVGIGGDVAFLNGTLKHAIANNSIDREFIDEHTVGFPELAKEIEQQSWEELERRSGCTRVEMESFAEMVGRARTAVFVWSMGITQHESGEDGVRAIINLALSKGFIGRERCGLMPIRGHSGVQGGAEMGAYSTAYPGGLAVNEENAKHLSDLWGFSVPWTKGLTAPEMIDAAHEDRIDVLISSGGNFLEVLPEPAFVAEALRRVPLRVHLDIVVASQMLLDPADTVVLLPVQNRYEMEGGVTETSTERRVIFSPEIPGPRIAEARPEWDIYLDLARRVRPDIADRLNPRGTREIREDIARTIPSYALIRTLEREGDQFQHGGAMLCAGWNFPTPDGKAHFSVVELPSEAELREGEFLVATRRGRQFNSMVQGERDDHTGAWRDSVLINQDDARRLGIADGTAVVLSNEIGRFAGRAFIAPIRSGMLEIHWPEGLVLIDRKRRSPQSGIPDYNAVVRVELVPTTVSRG
ncbi:MAG: FdhF/YdeP family oxidoreductase [Acidimicrobiales bacterium]